MMDTISLRDFLRKALLRQVIVGAFVISAVLLTSAYFVGRYKATLELQEAATSSAKAYRGQLLDGDIQFAETKLRGDLKIGTDEAVLVLGPSFVPLNQINGLAPVKPGCDTSGNPRVDQIGSRIDIMVPIFFDEKNENLFGYLYLSRKIHIDWIFLLSVGFVLAVGYGVMLLSVTRVTKNTLQVLANNLEGWADQLSSNPKNISSLGSAPFRELVPLQKAMEGLNQQISDFESKAADRATFLILRGIAHDLKVPAFQAQLKLATLKQMIGPDAKLMECVTEAMESIKNVSQVASQVKLLRELPNPEDHLDLNAAIGYEMQILRTSEMILEKQIDLAFKVASSNVKASMSKPELSRILQNLIQNAAHASQSGSRIAVELSTEGTDAVVTVKDQGHGISDDLKDKVFEPDFTSKPGVGTGLGLVIVKYLAKIRRGSVRLSSQKNVGTTIEVRIPLYAQPGVIHGV